MTVIVCVSDGGGVLFGGRRLSRDREVISDIARTAGDEPVFVSEYSEGLFSNSDVSVIAVSDPLSSAGEGDFTFIEDGKIRREIGRVESVIIYRWNRKYPFDVKIDTDPAKEGFSLDESVDIKGHSHEKITREIWRRK